MHCFLRIDETHILYGQCYGYSTKLHLAHVNSCGKEERNGKQVYISLVKHLLSCILALPDYGVLNILQDFISFGGSQLINYFYQILGSLRMQVLCSCQFTTFDLFIRIEDIWNTIDESILFHLFACCTGGFCSSLILLLLQSCRET